MQVNPTMLRRLTLRLSDEICTQWKRLLSFRKSEWSLIDYPIRIKKQVAEYPHLNSRFKTPNYHAQILNWHISGSGETKQEALRDLEQNFAGRKQAFLNKGRPIPRPGQKVPIEFGSQEKVIAYPELAEDFIHRVLELEWAWISDESSLWHFHAEENNDKYIVRIKEIYGADVSDIESAELWQIFERIESARRQSSTS